MVDAVMAGAGYDDSNTPDPAVAITRPVDAAATALRMQQPAPDEFKADMSDPTLGTPPADEAPKQARSAAPQNFAQNAAQGVAQGAENLGKAATDTGQKAGNWFGENRSWVIPLLKGVGAMASSNSRYLGSAILQGLGAGAESYSQEQQAQAGLGKTQAETQQIQAGTGNIQAETAQKQLLLAQGSLYTDKQGRDWVILANGAHKLFGDWYASPPGQRDKLFGETHGGGVQVTEPQRPRVYGAGPGAQAAAPGAAAAMPPTGPGGPAGGAPGAPGSIPPIAPAGGAATMVATPEDPAHASWGLGKAGQASVAQSAQYYNNNAAEYNNRVGDSLKREAYVNAQGQAARINGSNLNQLTKNLLDLPDTGLLTGGPLHDYQQSVIQKYNQFVTTFPQLGFQPMHEADIAAGKATEKLHAMNQFLNSSNAGQHSLGAAEIAGLMTPDARIDKTSATNILEGLYRDNQRAIDLQNYYQDYRKTFGTKNPGMGGRFLSQDIDNSFAQDHPEEQYVKEKAQIGNFLRAKTKDGKYLFNYLGERPQLADAYTKTPGASRYFTQH